MRPHCEKCHKIIERGETVYPFDGKPFCSFHCLGCYEKPKETDSETQNQKAIFENPMAERWPEDD